MPRSRPDGSTYAYFSSDESAVVFAVSDMDDIDKDAPDGACAGPMVLVSAVWLVSACSAGGLLTCGATSGLRLDCRWRPPRRRRRWRPNGLASPAPLTATGLEEGSGGAPTAATASAGRSSRGISPADTSEACASPTGSASPPPAVSSSPTLLARFASRSARRRSRQFSRAGGGSVPLASFFQSNVTPGFCASSARLTGSSKGSRPTLTPGGVRNQYRIRGFDGRRLETSNR